MCQCECGAWFWFGLVWRDETCPAIESIQGSFIHGGPHTRTDGRPAAREPRCGPGSGGSRAALISISNPPARRGAGSGARALGARSNGGIKTRAGAAARGAGARGHAGTRAGRQTLASKREGRDRVRRELNVAPLTAHRAPRTAHRAPPHYTKTRHSAAPPPLRRRRSSVPSNCCSSLAASPPPPPHTHTHAHTFFPRPESRTDAGTSLAERGARRGAASTEAGELPPLCAMAERKEEVEATRRPERAR